MYIPSFLKTLAVSWIDSFKFFLPKNLNLLLFATYKTILDLFRTVKSNLFYIILLFLAVILYKNNVFIWSKEVSYLLLNFIYIDFLIKVARPSVNNKNFKYFSNFYVTLKNLIVFPILAVLLIFIKKQLYTAKYINIGMYIFSPFIIFWLLFSYDAQKNYLEYLRSLKRSFLMVLYNYPFCFILYNIAKLIMFFLIFIKVNYIYNIYNTSIGSDLILLFLILPLYTFFMTNFYIIQVHNKFSLYYNNKSNN